MNVGKTTTANFLVERLNKSGFHARRISFGDPLRVTLAEALEMNVADFYGGKNVLIKDLRSFTDNSRSLMMSTEELYGVNPEMPLRALLQAWGENKRKAYEEIWEDYITLFMEQFKEPCIFVIDDCRRKREVDYCRNRGVCYRIMPYEGYENNKRYGSEHPTEHFIDGMMNSEFDGTLYPRKYGLFYLNAVAEKLWHRITDAIRENEITDAIHSRSWSIAAYTEEE